MNQPVKNSDPYRLTKAGAIRIVVIAFVLFLGVFYFLRKNGAEFNDLNGLFIASAIGLIFVILFMVIMALFVRRNYYETPMGKSQVQTVSKDNLLNVSNNNLQNFQKFGLMLFRWFAIPSIALIFLMAYDFIAPAVSIEKSLVLEKKETGKGPPNLRVQPLKSKYWYDAEANRPLFDATRNGDTLVIHKSRFFGNWKEVDVIQEGHSLQTFHGISNWSMMLVGCLFLAPILSFFLSNDRPIMKWVDNNQMVIWIIIPIMEILAMVFWIRFMLVWTGTIPKF